MLCEAMRYETENSEKNAHLDLVDSTHAEIIPLPM